MTAKKLPKSSSTKMTASAHAKTAAQNSKKRSSIISTKPPGDRTKLTSLTAEQRANAIVNTVEPLLEMFAVLDAVFTEDDALTEHKMMTLGRLYESWKRTRAALDPDWDSDERPRKRIGMRRAERLARRSRESLPYRTTANASQIDFYG